MIVHIMWVDGNENIYECDSVAILDTEKQVKVVAGNSTGPCVRWLDKGVGTEIFVKTNMGGLIRHKELR